jgi:photosystem II stability/assembly factor-like uncharacterized protein
MNKKFLLNIIFGFFILNTFASSIYSTYSTDAYWVRVPSPTTKWLYRCVFPDSQNGWVVGDSGVIIHTSNGGTSWVLQNSTLNYFIEDVFFLNIHTGWAIANDFFYTGTTILKTTNSGENWTANRYPDTSKVIYTVYYLDSLNGYLGGYSGLLLKTSDGGNSWAQQFIDSNIISYFPIEKFAFYNYRLGFACGGIIDISGVIWTSTNYGARWKAFSAAPEPLYYIMWKDSITAYSCGGDYEYGGSFLRTYNGGDTWDYLPMNIFGIAQKLAFRTKKEIWVPMGFSQRWAVSRDTGNSWVELLAPDTSSVYDTEFLDSLSGWTFGANGAIYRFNSDLIGINPQGQNLPYTNKLEQNYPNPFNPSTKIKFTLAKHTRVRITLYDALGRRVKVLLDDIREPGEYTLHFNGSGLSSGIYFYKLDAGSFTETHKMVLLK